MTVPNQEVPQAQQTEQKQNDKEYNFRQLEARHRRELAEERAKREEAEKAAREFQSRRVQEQDIEDDSEPYVDHKKLDRRLSSFEKKMEEKIEKKAEEKARMLLDQKKQEDWLRGNPDFYDIMQHAEKFAQANPDLAETILEMPEGFERQKLVYKNIKTLGIHQPPKQSSVQDKIDANRKSPYYQPSSVAAAPYNSGNADFSATGQKAAYQKMQELKARLRG